MTRQEQQVWALGWRSRIRPCNAFLCPCKVARWSRNLSFFEGHCPCRTRPCGDRCWSPYHIRAQWSFD